MNEEANINLLNIFTEFYKFCVTSSDGIFAEKKTAALLGRKKGNGGGTAPKKVKT